MGWVDLSSSDAVRKALNEFDQIGRDAFLGKYAFGKAARFVVQHEGKEYDAKAIIGAAHGFQFPERGPLRSRDFPSSERVVEGTLTALGFTVTKR